MQIVAICFRLRSTDLRIGMLQNEGLDQKHQLLSAGVQVFPCGESNPFLQVVKSRRPKANPSPAKEALAAGKSVVVDNTNADATTRRIYIDLANGFGYPTRCFYFTASEERCVHNSASGSLGHRLSDVIPARTSLELPSACTQRGSRNPVKTKGSPESSRFPSLLSSMTRSFDACGAFITSDDDWKSLPYGRKERN
jgi:AAA domain-containing protein